MEKLLKKSLKEILINVGQEEYPEQLLKKALKEFAKKTMEIFFKQPRKTLMDFLRGTFFVKTHFLGIYGIFPDGIFGEITTGKLRIFFEEIREKILKISLKKYFIKLETNSCKKKLEKFIAVSYVKCGVISDENHGEIVKAINSRLS